MQTKRTKQITPEKLQIVLDGFDFYLRNLAQKRAELVSEVKGAQQLKARRQANMANARAAAAAAKAERAARVKRKTVKPAGVPAPVLKAKIRRVQRKPMVRAAGG